MLLMRYNSRMKQIFSGVLGLSFLVFVAFYLLSQHSVKKEEKVLSSSPRVTISKDLHTTAQPITKTLFVPYWTVGDGKIDGGYSTQVYFGVIGDKNGIVTTDAGYENIDSFMANSSSPKKLLTVVMTDSDINASVLDSKTFQQNIETKSAMIAKQKWFEGVALDY